MAVVSLNTNLASLGALGQLTRASGELAGIYQRLTSGLRITRASDDAAGLSVAASLNVESRIYSQAVRNINDGLSATSISSEAIDALGSIATRIAELAQQSANGTVSDPQRQPLHAEARALVQEYNRIAATSAFNGLSLLRGSAGTLGIETGTGGSAAPIQVGVTGGVPQIESTTPNTNSLSFDGVDDYVGFGHPASFDFNGVFTASIWVKTTSVQNEELLSINGAAGWQWTIYTTNPGNPNSVPPPANPGEIEFELAATDGSDIAVTQTTGANISDGSWHNIVAVATNPAAGVYKTEVYIDGASKGSAIQAGTPGTGNGEPLRAGFPSFLGSRQSYSGSMDEIRLYDVAKSATEAANLATGADDRSGLVGYWGFDEGQGSTVDDGSGNGHPGVLTNGPTWDTSVPFAASPAQMVSLITQQDSLATLDAMKTVFTGLSQAQGQLGAQQSRLRSELANVQTIRLNYDDAYSRIMDADVASESANLTTTRIRQQAATAVLTTANAQPELALSLLAKL